MPIQFLCYSMCLFLLNFVLFQALILSFFLLVNPHLIVVSVGLGIEHSLKYNNMIVRTESPKWKHLLFTVSA